MANQVYENLQVDQLDLEALNDVLRRIQDRLDKLEGLRGQIESLAVVNSNAGVSVTDENGTVIHGFGNV